MATIDKTTSAGHPADGAMRLAAVLLFAAAAFMAAGGIIKRVTGADLDAALADGTLAGYFQVVADNQVAVVFNLSAWIVGVLAWGAAATVVARLSASRDVAGRIAMVCYWTGVPLAVASFVAWLALVVQVGPDAGTRQLATAEIVGWLASRADWIATALIAGLGSLLLSIAGRDDWAPEWLVWWGAVAAAAGAVTVVAIIAGGLSTYGQVIIPVGVGWTIATGMVLLRQTGTGRIVASGNRSTI